jgi:copper oxidase (laccase) domain-containing protein
MENIDSLPIDTLTDPAWHSFRRDKEQSGRNISFVARIRD